ncbi:MAG: hypothetical protein V7765_21340 [Oleispira sp.]
MSKIISIYNNDHVNLEIVLSTNSLPFFRLSVPNKTYCYGLIECVKRALKDLAEHELDETKEEYLKELTALRKIAIDGAYISYSELAKIEELSKNPIKVFLNAYSPIIPELSRTDKLLMDEVRYECLKTEIEITSRLRHKMS